MMHKGSDGVRIIDSEVKAGRDIVGGDIRHEEYFIAEQEEKNGFLLFIERAFTFIVTFLITGFIFGAIGAVIGGVIGGEELASLGAVIGAIVALAAAISGASNVSRYRTSV